MKVWLSSEQFNIMKAEKPQTYSKNGHLTFLNLACPSEFIDVEVINVSLVPRSALDEEQLKDLKKQLRMVMQFKLKWPEKVK